MNTFIFGAGASSHAGYPLASELGLKLRSWIQSLPKTAEALYLTEALGELARTAIDLSDFEAALEELISPRKNSSAHKVSAPRRDELVALLKNAICLYFRSINPPTETLYDRFSRAKIKPGDAVITFNYDVEAERSLYAAGLWNVSAGYGFDLTESPPPSLISIFKLHGSISWKIVLFGGRTGPRTGNLLGNRPAVLFSPELRRIGIDSFVDPLCHGLNHFPALDTLILPTAEKRFFVDTSEGRELEGFWDDLWHKASLAIRGSEQVTVIGYSLPRADTRARELIFQADRRAEITVCCGPSTPAIEAAFRAQGFSSLRTLADPSFLSWLDADA